jgi:hypothetical protein
VGPRPREPESRGAVQDLPRPAEAEAQRSCASTEPPQRHRAATRPPDARSPAPRRAHPLHTRDRRRRWRRKDGCGSRRKPDGYRDVDHLVLDQQFDLVLQRQRRVQQRHRGRWRGRGSSWFATSTSGNTGPVESFYPSASEPCTSSTVIGVSESCLINNSETSYPPATSLDTPCGGTGTPAYNNLESEDTSQSTNGGTAGAGEGCGGYSPTTSITGWQAYAGQLGYWGGAPASSGTSYTAYYGWLNWTVYTPALESGACDFTSPASTPWGPPTPNSETVSVPNTGTYTLTVGGGSGASGWQTAGAGKFGSGGSGSELTFRVTLTALQQLTVVAACGGFGNLGGLGFGNGGSSGFQPQGTYISNSDSLNGTPVLNGAGGGGGGASALCLSNGNVTSPTCTASTPLCLDTSPASSVTCVLAVAGGGGGGGTDYVCRGASCPQLALNTDCTRTGSDMNGGGGLSATSTANSFSGSWSAGTAGSGTGSSTHYFYGAGAAGATGGSSSATSSSQPQSYSGANPAPNTPTGGSWRTAGMAGGTSEAASPPVAHTVGSEQAVAVAGSRAVGPTRGNPLDKRCRPTLTRRPLRLRTST